MSKWSYVHFSGTASIKRKSFDDKTFFIQWLQRELEKAPKITGSEGDARIYFTIPPATMFKDIGDREIVYYNDFIFVVNGYLRDKTLKDTKPQVEEFIKWVKKNFYVDFLTNPVFDGKEHRSNRR